MVEASTRLLFFMISSYQHVYSVDCSIALQENAFIKTNSISIQGFKIKDITITFKNFTKMDVLNSGPGTKLKSTKNTLWCNTKKNQGHKNCFLTQPWTAFFIFILLDGKGSEQDKQVFHTWNLTIKYWYFFCDYCEVTTYIRFQKNDLISISLQQLLSIVFSNMY